MDSGPGPGFVDDEPPPEPRDGWLLVRIHVPELNVYKCLQFPSERLVWDVKQQVLASLPKELKESFNYGLFCPPSNGKAGKFLDEERRLGDYPFNGPVGYLELKYKRRVYKMLNLDERQLKALHTRANLRRFLECINGGHVEKIAKMCAKGLDPNFHCAESGETPLTLATGAKKPNKLLIALVNGGALLDYRTKDGTTALHRAVEKDSLEAVTTLLELGASPNYKDGRGITPLYISITRKCEAKITESLLHDHATLGVQDNQGWNEVHQACRHGLVQHLEHLLFYGADMDARNASGNTPLHVCAVNNQEACARMLLFRGAQRGALNYANQTPYQVAVIAGNLELAEIIQNYKSEEVVPFRGPPRYNPKRRSGIGWLSANSSLMGTLTRNSMCGSHLGGPPSPCPSEHLPYSSASSSLSEGSSGHRSHEDDISIVTDKSLGDTSDIISDSSGVGTNSDSAACSIGHPSTTVVCMESYAGTMSGHIRLQPGDVIEVVGSTDCGLLEGYVRGSNQSGFFPAECVQEVSLRQKNITNVSTSGSSITTTSTANHSPYQQHSVPSSIVSSSRLQGSPQLSVGGTLPRPKLIQHQHQHPHQHQHHSPSLSVNSGGSNTAINGNANANAGKPDDDASGNGGQAMGQYSSATAPRIKKAAFNEPRTVVLHRAKRGFGFILRGAKASSQLMQLKPSDRFPALQYLDDVDPGGVADMAGLRPGDFLLAINGEDVRAASHEHVVEMIRSAGALVSMTVISPQFPNQMQATPQYMPSHHLSSGPSTPQSSHRQCATLPRKMSLGPGRQPAPAPPRRDPKTTLSVGRARAKSMVAGLENGGEKDDDEIPHTKSSSVESIVTPTPTHPGTPVQLRTASIKARPTSSRITAAELEELFQRQQGEATESSSRYSTMMTTSRFQSGTDSGAATPPATANSPVKGPLVYGSVAEMKRKTKTKNGTLRGKPCAIPTVGGRDLKRFHSTPDLNAHINGSSSSSSSIWAAVGKGHHSQDDVATLHASMQRLNTLPPPTHPPPPPPVGQVVKVETRSTSEYESTLSLQQKLKKRTESDAVTSAAIDGVQSSFNPSANAKIYASPHELRNVAAWKHRQGQESRQNGGVQTSQTSGDAELLPPPPPPTQPAHEQRQASPYAAPTAQMIQRTDCSNQQKPSSHYAASQQAQNGPSNATTATGNMLTGPAPPIPEPDYSLSESDGEDENSILVARNTKLNEKIALIPETSGNSQASGSSSGSASISHSLSVDEIQRVRSNLKTSKSSPNGFKNNNNNNNNNINNNNNNNNNNKKSGEDEKSDTGKENNDGAKSNNRSNHHRPHLNVIDGNDNEEGDNSSSGVSSDQEIGGAAANATKSTDTIKKKPSVTIVEESKPTATIDETDGTIATINKLSATTSTSTTMPMPTTATATAKSNVTQATGNRTTVTITSAAAAISPLPITTTNVATTAAAFEAKASMATTTPTPTPTTTVTVKQMVQQQHAPVIQQQQQQMSSAAQSKVKTLVVQSQQVSSKAQPHIAGRLGQNTQAHQHIPQQHMNPNQKLLVTQQQILMQQQQQLAHQQHLHNILKAKTAATNTAAIVAKQQQKLHRASDCEYDGRSEDDEEETRRSDDDGELSPSPPAKAFQRHNSLTRKQAAAIAMQRATRTAAVSLVQLPPPIEGADSDNEFVSPNAAAAVAAAKTIAAKNASAAAAAAAAAANANVHAHAHATATPSSSTDECPENIVLAPPPQFCDCNDIKHMPQIPLHTMQYAQHHLHHQQQQHHHQQQYQQQQQHQQQQQQQQQQQLQTQQQSQPQQMQHVQHMQRVQLQQQQMPISANTMQMQQMHLQHQLQQMHPTQQHMMSAAGGMLHHHGVNSNSSSGSAASGNVVGTLGRVRIVGTVPKTNHHRMH